MGRNVKVDTTNYKPYPLEECGTCKRKWVIDHMGHIEGQHFCPEHYKELIETYGINVTLGDIEVNTKKIHSLYTYFVTTINTIAKYEKYYNTKLLDKVLVQHKELIRELGKDTTTINLVENDEILHSIMAKYLPLVVPQLLSLEELRLVHIDKSYYAIYYEQLTGKKSKTRGTNQWLL